MEIVDQLRQFGLKEKAAKAYLALLKLQKANPHQVAKEAEIERTTAYIILEELAEKGLASQSVEGKKIVYIAEPPKALELLLNKQQNLLTQILPMLEAFSGNKKAKPVIKFYENIDGIKQVLMDSINCEERLRRDFASVEGIVDFLGLQFINRQIKERIKRGVKVKSLRCVPKGSKISEKDWFLKKDNQDLLREVKYLDETLTIAPLIMVYDNVVAIISSKKESFALVIESQELSQAIKILFDIAWQQAKS